MDHVARFEAPDSAGLVVEALLMRGFLAFRDPAGVWLAKGSHPADLTVLADVVPVDEVQGHDLGMVQIRFAGERCREVAGAIAAIPWRRSFKGPPRDRRGQGSCEYCEVVWGAKAPVAPIDGSGGLDTGIALLVKVLPLARVRTRMSCDGHGYGPAWIEFPTWWDALWCRAVFELVAPPIPALTFGWSDPVTEDSGEQPDLRVASEADLYDEAWKSALIPGLQSLARHLFDADLAVALGVARAEVLEQLSKPRRSPELVEFDEVARRILARRFATDHS